MTWLSSNRFTEHWTVQDWLCLSGCQSWILVTVEDSRGLSEAGEATSASKSKSFLVNRDHTTNKYDMDLRPPL